MTSLQSSKVPECPWVHPLTSQACPLNHQALFPQWGGNVNSDWLGSVYRATTENGRDWTVPVLSKEEKHIVPSNYFEFIM